MTGDQIERLAALDGEATPGPEWVADYDNDERAFLVLDERGGSVVAAVYDCGTPGDSARANARLIVAMRNSTRALLRVARVARKILNAWEVQEARSAAWQKLSARARAPSVTSGEWMEIKRDRDRLNQPLVADLGELRAELGRAFGA